LQGLRVRTRRIGRPAGQRRVEFQEARPQEVKIRGRSAPLIVHTLKSARGLPYDSDEIRAAKISAA
jgi:hypothetical protein